MKKMPTIFKRNPKNMSEIFNEPHPDCDWVFNGEGVATKKYDGTCVMIERGVFYKRRMVRPDKAAPDGFREVDRDSITGKRFGWVVVGDGSDDKYHREVRNTDLLDGTYELVGYKIQGNPEREAGRRLIRHGVREFAEVPRTFDGLRAWLKPLDIEGLVFYHPDGRMAKIKKKDFGLSR